MVGERKQRSTCKQTVRTWSRDSVTALMTEMVTAGHWCDYFLFVLSPAGFHQHSVQRPTAQQWQLSQQEGLSWRPLITTEVSIARRRVGRLQSARCEVETNPRFVSGRAHRLYVQQQLVWQFGVQRRGHPSPSGSVHSGTGRGRESGGVGAFCRVSCADIMRFKMQQSGLSEMLHPLARTLSELSGGSSGRNFVS